MRGMMAKVLMGLGALAVLYILFAYFCGMTGSRCF